MSAQGGVERVEERGGVVLAEDERRADLERVARAAGENFERLFGGASGARRTG